MPLLAGRPLDEHDDRSAEPVVLVSRTLAVRFWTVPDAVGKTLTIEDGEAPRQARIVGVVGDVKHYGLDAELTPDLYTPVPQVPDVTVQWLNNNMYWGVRTHGDPAALAEPFRRALKEVDADVPAAAIRTMNDALGIALAPRRLNLTLVQAFAVHGARPGGRRRLCRHRVLGRAAAARDRHPLGARRRHGPHR